MKKPGRKPRVHPFCEACGEAIAVPDHHKDCALCRCGLSVRWVRATETDKEVA